MSDNSAMAVGDSVTIEISGISSTGAGVGRLPDGRVVFAHRTAPGDRARLRIDALRPRWGRATLEEVIEPGPQRREAPCPRYERCGGCTLEHLEYDAQLRAKGALVTEALTRIGGRSDVPEPDVHRAPSETRYRNRATFTLRRLAHPRVVAGFHELGGPGRILDLGGECLLLEEGVAAAWEALRAGWGLHARHLPAGRELRLTLRGLADGTSILVIEGGSGRGTPEAILAAVDGLRAVWAAPGGGAPQLLAGEDQVEEEWLGERIVLQPGAFLQANRAGAAILHAHVLHEIGSPTGLRILDAYCGFGGTGRALARQGADVIGIEIDARAREMVAGRPVEGFVVLEGRVEDRLDEALPVDRVILNPPRQGAAREVMEALARGTASRVVYVSCDPATLARDLERLGPDFALRRLQVFDLFPQTAHVETVATLER